MKLWVFVFITLFSTASTFANYTPYSRQPLYQDLHDIRYVAYKDFVSELMGNIDVDVSYYISNESNIEISVKELLKKHCWGECDGSYESKFQKYTGEIPNTVFDTKLLKRSRVESRLKRAVKNAGEHDWKIVDFHYSDGAESFEAGIMVYSAKAGEIIRFSVLHTN